MTANPDLDAVAVAIRVAAALLAGALIGVDRELQRKPAGLRTHALVSLGAAVVVLAVVTLPGANHDATSRAIQGIITGIGFLGAGVILQHESERRIEGLTTAASIWVAAGLGVACGAGLFTLAAIGTAGAILLLTGGNWVEDALKRILSPVRGEDRERERDKD